MKIAKDLLGEDEDPLFELGDDEIEAIIFEDIEKEYGVKIDHLELDIENE